MLTNMAFYGYSLNLFYSIIMILYLPHFFCFNFFTCLNYFIFFLLFLMNHYKLAIFSLFFYTRTYNCFSL
jgi:hypothetical protein